MINTLAGRLAVAGLAFCALLASLPASAQSVNWPTKPVKLVVPFPPGGSVDPLARLLAVRLIASMEQQFIVENKPGASDPSDRWFRRRPRMDTRSAWCSTRMR